MARNTREWKQYAFIGHLDRLEMLKAMFYTHSYGRHFHDGYALGLILAGSETYDCNRTTNVAPQGSVVAVNPGEIHNGHASDRKTGWGYFMIYPHLSLIRSALANLELNSSDLPYFPESVIRDPQLSATLFGFMEAVEAGDSRLALETRFLELLHALIRRHGDFSRSLPAPASGRGKIGRVMETIYDQPCESLSLEALAGSVDLSPWSLLRLFKKQTGITPYMLQTGLKLRQAKQDLASGTSLADTAARCGFSDQSHMTKQFKRWMGITPGEYAASRLFPATTP